MQGWKRRVTYVALFEILATTISAIVLKLMSGEGAAHSTVLAVIISTTAMAWNLVYNYVFELWENRQRSQTRTPGRRLVHAIGFQVTLVVLIIPLISWWFGVSLIQALFMELALIVFFPIFTFVFTWIFDAIFGLPQSARPDWRPSGMQHATHEAAR